MGNPTPLCVTDVPASPYRTFSWQIQFRHYHQSRPDKGAPENRPLFGSKHHLGEESQAACFGWSPRSNIAVVAAAVLFAAEFFFVGLPCFRIEFPKGDRRHDSGHKGQYILQIELGLAEH